VAKILVVEDLKEIRELVVIVLEGLKHQVIAVEDGVHGLAQIMTQDFDLAVVDEDMGGGEKNGSRMMEKAQKVSRPLKRVIATSSHFFGLEGNGELEQILREKCGVIWLVLLPKPFMLTEFATAVASILALPV